MSVSIQDIVDKYLEYLISTGMNTIPIPIESEMADPKQNPADEWRNWLPLKGQVSNEDINAFEAHIGYALPESYKAFLRYKHFYELLIDEASFCRHPVHTWRSSLDAMIFDGYPREWLIDKGYIPFAIWNDWGLLCFDTTSKTNGTNYPVVLWDHEQVDVFAYKASDFETLLSELDNSATNNNLLYKDL